MDEASHGLSSLPPPGELQTAALRVGGLRRQPEGMRGEGASPAALRGVLLVATVILAWSGEGGAKALGLVRGVLQGVWRASSLVECLNSVARMQQGRHRKMTQRLLDLKRVYWNCRKFRTGRRRGQTPYGLHRLKLPTEDWWESLKLTPQQLRERLGMASQKETEPSAQELSARPAAA